MNVSLDGGLTWIETSQDVLVNVNESTDTAGSLTFRFTPEEIVVDLWGPLPHAACLATSVNSYADTEHALLVAEQLIGSLSS